jgi:hypothetical protein
VVVVSFDSVLGLISLTLSDILIAVAGI